jgi:hypothetical protein
MNQKRNQQLEAHKKYGIESITYMAMYKAEFDRIKPLLINELSQFDLAVVNEIKQEYIQARDKAIKYGKKDLIEVIGLPKRLKLKVK